uniref:Uncharacterized protein n=1 Tax=Myoviridae sp. ctTrm2 TaxID=2825114 RepID=A0A8S5UK60_9CAUD|nr:MAG TPA: hypothetical protein [Myoviridae sp. ctTrm2]DAY51503.1 MAG TPA: hypothetical protein [Caudoviricetes sp.]
MRISCAMMLHNNSQLSTSPTLNFIKFLIL